MAQCDLQVRVRIVGCVILMIGFGCTQPVQPATTPAAWQAAFRQQVQGADTLSIVIRTGCNDDTEIAKFDLKGRKVVQEFVDLIEIRQYDGGFVSICGGYDTLTFSRGDQTLLKLGRTPLTALSWDDPAWQGDAVVSREAYQRITKWFAARGFPYFSEELQAVEESARQRHVANETSVADSPR